MKPVLFKFISFLLAIFINASIFSQRIYEKEDVLIFDSICKLSVKDKLVNKATDFDLTTISKYFLGTKYKSGTCEIAKNETLIINLREFDCVTFVENMIAFFRVIKTDSLIFNYFCNEIKKLRYRNGILNKYPSRLHYFTEWIYNNQEKKLIANITKKIGGVSYNKTINFMSSHYNSYDKLKKNPDFIGLIKKAEDIINKREMYYIPKNDISKIKNKIENGDIIAITTSIKGLDVAHVGIAYWVKSDLHMIHASLDLKKVTVTQNSLENYLKKYKHHTGIIVSRVNKL